MISAHSIPKFLTPYKDRAANWAGLMSDEIIEVLVTEHPDGAPIGWHRVGSIPANRYTLAATREDMRKRKFKCRQPRLYA